MVPYGRVGRAGGQAGTAFTGVPFPFDRSTVFPWFSLGEPWAALPGFPYWIWGPLLWTG